VGVVANGLANERSLYLRQHADNPVNWLPWGEEAFALARERDVPLLVSIGYAACHWCHVMEQESFSDPEVAALMNDHFVCVKVDREERPDVDEYYMDAVQALRGQGGWPLNACCTPDGKPFFAGTYFPPEPRGGIPSWREVLTAIAEAWQNQRTELEDLANRLHAAICAAATVSLAPRQPTEGLAETVEQALAKAFDVEYGGFGEGAKFPQAPALLFLSQRAEEGSVRAGSLLDRTLEAIARGGIRDQIGGGFHRYTVDRSWRIPHFEKMLYDNALLLRLFSRRYLATANPTFKEAAADTVRFLTSELAAPDGLFSASLDADSPGGEGAYYLWRAAELRELLGPLYGSAAAWLGVREEGNCAAPNGPPPGTNVLYLAGPQPAEADEIKDRLRTARSQRPRPARDEKAVVAWNGLAVAGLAEAAVALASEEVLDLAQRAAEALLAAPRTEAGLLPRAGFDQGFSGEGFLEDHAYLLDGLVALFEVSCEERFLEAAADLADRLLFAFYDPAAKTFFTAADREGRIPARTALEDSALPAAGPTAAIALHRLYQLTGESRYASPAEALCERSAGLVERYPLAFATAALAHAFRQAQPRPLACRLPRPAPAAS